MVDSASKKAVDEETLRKFKETAESILDLYAKPEFDLDLLDDSFEILSTIRYDPLLSSGIDVDLMFNPVDDNSKLYFLFDEHFHRLNFELNYFKIDFSLEREELLKNLNNSIIGLDKSLPYRLRVSINRRGKVNITVLSTPLRFNLLDGFSPLETYTSPLYNVYLDSEPILISPFTSFKTTKRDQYNLARQRSLDLASNEPQEVLLYNTAHQVTEGSITNIALKQKDPDTGRVEWYTPVLASGCLCGVVRHMLLSKGLIKEKLIHLKDVRVGEEVLLFNGLIGVMKGIVAEKSF